MKPKVAIACQGGGSQTAFTAGVFKALAENNVRDHFDTVSISGTSGGAICGFLLWYAIKRDEKPLCQRILDFWDDNTAKIPWERLFNDAMIHSLFIWKRVDPSISSEPLISAGTRFPFGRHLRYPQRIRGSQGLAGSPCRRSRTRSLGRQPEPPILVIGARNVLTGRLHKFSSYLEPIKIDHLLASACVPSIFPAVQIDGVAYWDGLFSDNPPIATLIDPQFVGSRNIPNEIWVIKIYPNSADEIPVASHDILDRHNELTGIISLFHSLRQIERINDFIIEGAFKDEFLAKFDNQGADQDPAFLPRRSGSAVPHSQNRDVGRIGEKPYL